MSLELSIFTLNVWGIPYVSKDREVRMEAIGSELALGNYDLVSLQEVWSNSDFELIREKTRAVLPYSHYFYSGVVGSGLCVFSKWPIITTFFHAWSVNGYVHRIQHGDWFGGKGVGMCKILVDDQVINFYIAHLHAEYDRNCDDYKAHRVIQAFDTAQFIENTRGSAVVQILAGDLNTEPGDLAYRVLLHEASLTDAFDGAYKRFGTNECPSNSYSSLDQKLSEEVNDGKRIDYIMYRGGFKYDVERVDYSHPLPDFIPGQRFSYSDHEAVLTKLLITKVGRKLSHFDREMSCEEAEKKSNMNLVTIKESISVCQDSLKRLETNQIIYLTLSILCAIILILFIDMHAGYGLWTLYLLLKVFIVALVIYFAFMATIWNKLEKHGILAGKLDMEISLQNKFKE